MARRGQGLVIVVGESSGQDHTEDAHGQVPDQVWAPAIEADGDIRDGAEVVEITRIIDLTAWPTGSRVIVRREQPHPGAQLSLFESAGEHRYTAFITEAYCIVPDATIVPSGFRTSTTIPNVQE